MTKPNSTEKGKALSGFTQADYEEALEVLRLFVDDEAREIRVPVSEWADSTNKWGRAKRILAKAEGRG